MNRQELRKKIEQLATQVPGPAKPQPDKAVVILEQLAKMVQQVVGKNAEIIVNVPEQKQPNIEVNVPEPKKQEKPEIVVNVPPQEKPEIIVNVPEQKLPEIKFPKQKPAWNELHFKVIRDNRGLISDVVLTKEG